MPTRASYRNKVILANAACLSAFSFPSFSIKSVVSLMPAVSSIVTGAPFKLNIFETTSLVVPAFVLTIETSSSVK